MTLSIRSPAQELEDLAAVLRRFHIAFAQTPGALDVVSAPRPFLDWLRRRPDHLHAFLEVGLGSTCRPLPATMRRLPAFARYLSGLAAGALKSPELDEREFDYAAVVLLSLLDLSHAIICEACRLRLAAAVEAQRVAAAYYANPDELGRSADHGRHRDH